MLCCAMTIKQNIFKKPEEAETRLFRRLKEHAFLHYSSEMRLNRS